jgi:hypothetical protein
MNGDKWIKEHKNLLIDLKKLGIQKKNITKKIQELKNQLNILDDSLLNKEVCL